MGSANICASDGVCVGGCVQDGSDDEEEDKERSRLRAPLLALPTLHRLRLVAPVSPVYRLIAFDFAHGRCAT